MRELKFRAWSNSLKCYFYDVAIYPNNVVAIRRSNIESMALETEGMTHWTELDDAIIEQYTGLKDKNGKEIYEGDIVDNGCSPICKIRWSEHFTAFEAVNEGNGYVSNIWYVAKYGEVIGNIHEDKELLEEE